VQGSFAGQFNTAALRLSNEGRRRPLRGERGACAILAVIVSALDTLCIGGDADGARPLVFVCESELTSWRDALPPAQRAWVLAQGFGAERLRPIALPDEQGGIAAVAFGLGAARSRDELSIWQAASLPDRLPEGRYVPTQPLSPAAATALVLGWLLGAYRLDGFRSTPQPAVRARLHPPAGADLAYALSAGAALNDARDLINAPANELGPAELAEAIVAAGAGHGARTRIVSGAELEREYPLVHGVGGASARGPCLIDLRWGEPDAPRVTLVGKGVCFDSGGLDLKPAAGMLLMKKDMGGAAVALATARMLMDLAAPVQLRLLVPAVENAVAGNAYRPGDVLRARSGLTVEVNNTDAEGRLILADALADADAESPDLLVDFATLTGAARTALGPELPAAFSPDDELLEQARRLGDTEQDPIWPMPLWGGYDDDLASKVADVSNVASHAFAGAIIGGLFLKRFVPRTRRWLHLDLHAWNTRERPGRPVGAEAQCARLVYRLIRARCG
jgi:leucyl aminopeptidase